MKTFNIFVLFILGLLFTCAPYSQFWSEDTSGVNVQLNSVVKLNTNRAWCCGNNGTVLKVITAFYQGKRWVNVSGNGIPAGINLVNITCPSSDTNIALTTGTTGGITYVYRTSNGGASWSQVFSQTNGRINAMWFATSPVTTAIIQGNPVGGRWSLFKSTNSGVSWDSAGMYLPQNGSETGWPNSAYYFADRVWFGTNNSRLYYSTNNGGSWSVQSTAPEVNSYAVYTNMGPYIVYSGGTSLMRSTNSGLNFSPVPSIGTGNFGGFGNFSPFWWYVRSDNKIYMTSNNGTNWVIQSTSPAGNYTHLFHMWGNLEMYAVRSNGGIAKYVLLVGIKQISSGVPEKFELGQNYPNPFNPQTKIKFAVPKGSFTKLIVYDQLGREVNTLVNEELKPGMYEADWDASGYSSGVYFYKLVTLDYTLTRKMVLMK